MTMLFAPPENKLSWVPTSGSPIGTGAKGYFDVPVGREGQHIIPGLEAHMGRGDHIIVLLMGRRGQGKTLFETTMLHRQMKAYQRSGSGKKLFSNYHVSFFRPDFDKYSPYLIDDMADYEEDFQHGYMAIDEMQNVAASRRSMSKTNVNVAQFLTQLRHRDIEAIFTTQFPQVLDYQILLQVDYFIRVTTRRRDSFGFPDVMELEIFDYWGQFTGRDYRKPWPPQPQDIDDTRLVTIPSMLRGTYNTNEIIASSYWGNEVRERVILTEAEKQGHDAEWLAELKGPIEEAKQSREDQGRRAEGTFVSLEALLQYIATTVHSGRRSLNLAAYIEDAMLVSGFRITSPRELAQEINKSALGVTAAAYTNPNKSISYRVGETEKE